VFAVAVLERNLERRIRSAVALGWTSCDASWDLTGSLRYSRMIFIDKRYGVAQD